MEADLVPQIMLGTVEVRTLEREVGSVGRHLEILLTCYCAETTAECSTGASRAARFMLDFYSNKP